NPKSRRRSGDRNADITEGLVEGRSSWSLTENPAGTVIPRSEPPLVVGGKLCRLSGRFWMWSYATAARKYPIRTKEQHRQANAVELSASNRQYTVPHHQRQGWNIGSLLDTHSRPTPPNQWGVPIAK